MLNILGGNKISRKYVKINTKKIACYVTLNIIHLFTVFADRNVRFQIISPLAVHVFL